MKTVCECVGVRGNLMSVVKVFSVFRAVWLEKMKRLFYITVALLLFTAADTVLSANEDLSTNITINAPVVEIIVTSRFFDPVLPWRSSSPLIRKGYGIPVSRSEVICPEPLIRGQRLVELQLPRSARKIQATVVAADPQAGLALLQTTAPLPAAGFKLDTSALEKGINVTLYQLDETREIEIISGKVAQHNVRSLPSTPHSILMMSLHMQQPVSGSGIPVVLADGSLAAISVSTEDNARTAQSIPSVMIARFLSDARNPPFTGLPSAGFIWSPLADPYKRAYLGIDDDEGGILIQTALPGTAAGNALLPQDVIIRWNNIPIDENGYYSDREYGRTLFPHLISGRGAVNQTAELLIKRNTQPLTITLKLARSLDSNNLIPENFTGEPAPYLVEGGLILRELTGNYLRNYGSEWERKIDPKLLHYYMTKRLTPDLPGERILIMCAVLPDEINSGYQNYQNMILTHANGEKVNNIEHLFAIRARDGFISRLRFDGMQIDIILDAAELAAANARIKANYHIPDLRRSAEDRLQ